MLMKLWIALCSYLMADRTDEDRGATVAEYALLVALIAVVVVGSITLFGSALSTFFGSLPTKLGFS